MITKITKFTIINPRTGRANISICGLNRVWIFSPNIPFVRPKSYWTSKKTGTSPLILLRYFSISQDCTLKFLQNPLWCAYETLSRASKIPPLTVEDFTTLSKQCLLDNFYQFDNDIYKFSKGLPMGFPLAPLITEVFRFFRGWVRIASGTILTCFSCVP